MNKRKSKLDEMQEQKLLMIERNGCWLAFFGIFLALMVQIIIGGENLWQKIVGEWIVLMSLSVYIVTDCLKNGIWSRCYEPSPKANAIGSLAAGIVSSAVIFAGAYIENKDMLAAVIAGTSGGIFTFVISLIVTNGFGVLYKKRLKKLETDSEEEFK